ncbi:MAG: YjcZ-like family protein, partial [Bdellovibrionaceae bacterium]|nr:YjcZ-like family protein [Pseudobdellovibrionaceae bacterium]
MSPDHPQTRVPLIHDQLLIDLVNGIHTNQSLATYRASRGFFGKLLDSLTGRDYDQNTLMVQNLTRGQEALVQITAEISNKLQFAEYALRVTQQSLLETREALNRNTRELRELADQQAALTGELLLLIQRKFNEQQQRIVTLERRVTAREDFDRIFSMWESGQSYQGLPWAVQILCLAREIYNSSIAYLELEQQNTYYRDLLVNKIVTHQRLYLPKHFFSTTTLLQQTWQATESSDQPLLQDLLRSCRYPSQYPLLHTFTILYL